MIGDSLTTSIVHMDKRVTSKKSFPAAALSNSFYLKVDLRTANDFIFI